MWETLYYRPRPPSYFSISFHTTTCSTPLLLYLSNDPSYYITPTPSPLTISSFPSSINLLNFQIKSLKTLSDFCSLQWRLQALSRQFLLCVSPIQSSRLLHLLKPKDCWVSISHTPSQPSGPHRQPSGPHRPTKASQTPRTSLLPSSARSRRLQSVLHNPQKFKN